MLERSEKALRLLCLVLGAVLLLQVVIKIVAGNPLAGLTIPALPTVTNAVDSASGGKTTNNVPAKAAEAQVGGKATNNVSANRAGGKGTNLVSRPSGSKDTNAVAKQTANKTSTNVVAEPEGPKAETNASAPQLVAKGGTNSSAEADTPKSGTNAVVRLGPGKGGTNSLSLHEPSGKGTNASARAEMAMKGPNASARPGMMGKRGPDLPLPIQARVDRVVDSELFGQVFHPMPSGLMGIAGNMAFLRAPNGQTSAVKEGDELGGIKLLRIGVNRVLVEEDGQKKELMIFEGLGGQSLLPK